jgi:hypothetical protein
MPDEQIDPASLQGDALTQWYLRSPADIEDERQAAAARRYQEFFGGYPGADPDPGFDRGYEAPAHDIDPGFSRGFDAPTMDVDPGFSWVQAGPNRWRSVPNSTSPDVGDASTSQVGPSTDEGSANAFAASPPIAFEGTDGGWDAAGPLGATQAPYPTSTGAEAIRSAADEGPQGNAQASDYDPAADIELAPVQLADTSGGLLTQPTFGFARGSDSDVVTNSAGARPPVVPSKRPAPFKASQAASGAAAIGNSGGGIAGGGSRIAAGMAPANAPSGRGPTAAAAARSRSSVGHPGFAESLIPVWGSGREAVADFQEGNYASAALNGALAASDLFLAESVAKGLAKGGFYVAKNVARKAPYDWDKVVRPWMGKQGFLEASQHGHHWAIPQNGWGKKVPDAIKNQPWNIKPMPSAEVHGRIAGSYKGKPQFNAAERYWYGTPAWSKVATEALAGHPVAAAMAQSDDRE